MPLLEKHLTTDVMNSIEKEVGTFNENFNEIATDHCLKHLSLCGDDQINHCNASIERNKVLDFVKHYFGY